MSSWKAVIIDKRELLLEPRYKSEHFFLVFKRVLIRHGVPESFPECKEYEWKMSEDGNHIAITWREKE